MNIIQKIKNQLEDYHINDKFLKFYNKSTDFKLKFFSPIVFSSVFIWALYSFFKYHIQLNSFFEYFIFFFLGCFVQPLIITLFFSYMIPINGTFFKFISQIWSKNKILKSFIDTADYQDSVLFSLYENKNFKENLISFYKFLDKINFATSYQKDVVNYKNKKIKENLDNLLLIIKNDSKSDFLKFFKNKFISDFQSYCTDEAVLEMLQINSNHEIETQKEKDSVDDLFQSMREELNLKNKFKNVL
jgi:hypothetical protein